MLHLRDLGLLDLSRCSPSPASRSAASLDWWETSERRKRLRERLFEQDGVDPDDVIMSPARAREQGLTSTVTFPRGNLAPEGSVIKSTAIDPSVVDADGVYRKTGPARVFTREKRRDRGDQGAGRPADPARRRPRPDGPRADGGRAWKRSTRSPRRCGTSRSASTWRCLTDARFSGVSTGACIGHVSPEALAGGPIGKVRDGDLIRIVVDRSTSRARSTWSAPGREFGRTRVLAGRVPTRSSRPIPLPDDTRLWAALQAVAAAPGAAASTTPTRSSSVLQWTVGQPWASALGREFIVSNAIQGATTWPPCRHCRDATSRPDRWKALRADQGGDRCTWKWKRQDVLDFVGFSGYNCIMSKRSDGRRSKAGQEKLSMDSGNSSQPESVANDN